MRQSQWIVSLRSAAVVSINGESRDFKPPSMSQSDVDAGDGSVSAAHHAELVP